MGGQSPANLRHCSIVASKWSLMLATDDSHACGVQFSAEGFGQYSIADQIFD
jgi:7-keto-8-aminopelargonate synthetase-like enzyme